MDYQWDKSELKIPENVKCLCGSSRCRGFLMRAEKVKPRASRAIAKPADSSPDIVDSKS
jgi:hypothetical protein